MRRPLEPAGAGEREVGAKRRAHLVDEAAGAPRLETLLPPEPEHLHHAGGAIDSRLDPPDEAVPEEDREHVVAPPSLALGDVHLPDPVEVEERLEEAAVPHQRVERREERNRRRRVGRRGEELELVAKDEARPPNALDRDPDELAVADELLAQRRSPRMLGPLRRRPRGAQPTENLPGAADAQEAVRAVAREELVPELLAQRHLARERLFR